MYPYLRNSKSLRSVRNEENNYYNSVHVRNGLILSNVEKDRWFLTTNDDIVKMVHAKVMEDDIIYIYLLFI